MIDVMYTLYDTSTRLFCFL